MSEGPEEGTQQGMGLGEVKEQAWKGEGGIGMELEKQFGKLAGVGLETQRSRSSWLGTEQMCCTWAVLLREDDH